MVKLPTYYCTQMTPLHSRRASWRAEGQLSPPKAQVWKADCCALRKFSEGPPLISSKPKEPPHSSSWPRLSCTGLASTVCTDSTHPSSQFSKCSFSTTLSDTCSSPSKQEQLRQEDHTCLQKTGHHKEALKSECRQQKECHFSLNLSSKRWILSYPIVSPHCVTL